MIPDFGGGMYDGQLRGYVFKNTTFCRENDFPLENCTIANVTVSAGGGSSLSNETGKYLFPIKTGNITVIAAKEGWNSIMLNISVDQYEFRELNLTMSQS
jgi:hypothetical protein